MRKLLWLVMGFLLLSGQLMAQNRTVSGKVTDDGGSPVPNASITVKGTSIGTTTKVDGTFSLAIPSNAKVLVISSVNMLQQEVIVGTESVINVSLKPDDKALQEVVVTGYSREKKSTFVGSASVLSSKVVETVPVGSFDQALQGRAPGMLVNSSSGQPGSSPTITIRGIQSITGAGAQPLFIIDGVPTPAADFQTLNANDFETITILKDAGAAALYGARGGLGVVVITTKRGKAGATNLTYRTQLGFTQKPNTTNFDMMNTKEILQYEERLKLTGNPGWEYSKNNPKYNTLQAGFPDLATQRARYDFLLDSFGRINTDYTDILFRQGLSQTHELNMSGGNDKTRFFVSAGYFDQKGTDLASRLKRYTTRFNLDHTAGRLSVQFNVGGGYSITNYSEGELLGNSARNSFQMSWRAKPYENPYRADGSLIFGANSSLVPKQIGNVIEEIEHSLYRQNQIKVNSGLIIAYKILPFLTARNTFGVDVANDRWQRFVEPLSYYGSIQNFQSGFNSEANKTTTNLINTSSLLFSQRFNKHEIDVGAYFEVVKGYQKSMGFYLYNLDGRLRETGQGTGTLPVSTAPIVQQATSAQTQFGIRSYFATAKYTYDGKYTVTGNVRRDGTSRIVNKDNREITTYSFGAIWNAIQENFLMSQNILSDLKVRVSYGSVPNIGSISTSTFARIGIINGTVAYASSPSLTSVTNYQGNQIPSYENITNFAGSSITGQVPTTPGNPDLKIETIQKFNIGADFAVWRNRARFTVDVYSNKTVDLFVNKQLGATTGFAGTPQPINAGTMTNKGIELTGAVDIVKTHNVDVSFGINHAINKNKIVSLGGVPEYFAGTFLIREGLSYGSHYTTHYLGADPATGKPKFETLDGKETLDPGAAASFAKFGTYLPKHVGGFNFDFRFKAITVSAFFSYQFDVVRSNNIENWVTRGVAGYQSAVNGSKRLLTDQWQQPGDVKFYQNPAYDRGFTSSDLQDAKFLRFRNLVVAYQIPAITVGNTKLIRSSRFYVQAQNIWVWSPWRGPDPEDGNNISLNEFPNPRMFVAGFDINF